MTWHLWVFSSLEVALQEGTQSLSRQLSWEESLSQESAFFFMLFQQYDSIVFATIANKVIDSV